MALNWNTHLQQYKRITNLVTFKNIKLWDKSLGYFLPFLIILILKQDLTVYTLFILGEVKYEKLPPFTFSIKHI